VLAGPDVEQTPGSNDDDVWRWRRARRGLRERRRCRSDREDEGEDAGLR